MKIFLVEDDSDLNTIIYDIFCSLGYEVASYKDGKEAFNNIINEYDLYIIDLNLPNVNGIELVKHIKNKFKNANIFVISADNNIETILKAYDIGCSDYIKKPFDIREIIAKIEHTLQVQPKNIKLKDCCEYNKIEKKIIYDDKSVQLTNKEALLLEILLDNANKSISNQKIEAHVWGDNFGNGYVKQLVSKVRNKLPCDIIKNQVLNGYKIEL